MRRRRTGPRSTVTAVRPPNPQASVIVPTIGRPEQLGSCLAALCAANPPPDEIVVVDQSGARVARDVAAACGDARVRVVDDEGRGPARARNRGAQAARGRLLLFIDDDCEADPTWVGIARRLCLEHPGALLTGQVTAIGDRNAVPSVREDPDPRDYTGKLAWAALYSGNMAVVRDDLLSFGGFDERLPSGEDNDLCYRWLRAGRMLRYEPDLIVTHMDWRTPEELDQVRTDYSRAQGMFYAKHLRAGDLRVLWFLLGDLRTVLRIRLAGEPARTPGVPAITQMLHSIPRNWRRFR